MECVSLLRKILYTKKEIKCNIQQFENGLCYIII